MVSKKEADAYVISILNPEFFYILLHRIRFKESIKNLLCNQPKPTSRSKIPSRDMSLNSLGKWCSFPQELSLHCGLNYLENYFIEDLEDLTAILLSLHLLFCKVPAVFNIFLLSNIILFPN